MTRTEILAAIDGERERQSEKWNKRHDWGSGDCSMLTAFVDVIPGEDHVQWERLVKAAVLAEEAGEVVKAALDVDVDQFRIETIQTAAVAFAILEGLPS